MLKIIALSRPLRHFSSCLSFLVQQGIFNPENVGIFMGQRFIELISSALGFAVVAALYTQDNNNNTCIHCFCEGRVFAVRVPM